jgi:formylglycine-generating enzyme required for sulfatase activity
MGATPLGVYDLAGNVSEWTGTVDVKTGKTVVKGGSYYNAIDDMYSSDRRINNKDEISSFIGFRCAMSIGSNTKNQSRVN